jgi:hypothetical protein
MRRYAVDFTSFDITMWCLTIPVGFGRGEPLDVSANGPRCRQAERYQEPALALTHATHLAIRCAR